MNITITTHAKPEHHHLACHITKGLLKQIPPHIQTKEIHGKLLDEMLIEIEFPTLEINKDADYWPDIHPTISIFINQDKILITLTNTEDHYDILQHPWTSEQEQQAYQQYCNITIPLADPTSLQETINIITSRINDLSQLPYKYKD